jgi:hypothetical protein
MMKQKCPSCSSVTDIPIIMRETQMAILMLGMKPAPITKGGLCAPAIMQHDRGEREVWDSELGGTVMEPFRHPKGERISDADPS